MIIKILYYLLIIIINSIGFIFVGIAFIGSPQTNSEAINHISDSQLSLGSLLYIVFISFIFTLFTLLINFLFKKKLLFSSKYITFFAVTQLLVYILIYYIIYLLMYIK